MNHGWTGGQYSLYRAALGVYLFVHFAALIPWGTELFSRDGALASGASSPLFHLFPNVLILSDAPGVVRSLLVLGMAAAIPLAIGTYDRIAALVLWYLWACLFGRNPLIANPSLPFLGWLLLAHAVVPRAPFGSWAAKGRADPRGSWHLPGLLFLAAWVVMSVGYLYSGATKLVSPSWVDGSALARVLENPLARPSVVRELLLSLPPIVLSVATWSALALELLFAPLAIFRRIRPWVWAAMVAMHLGLLLVIDFADLTFGMLLLHAFTFDAAWIRPARRSGEVTVFYDGDCGLCHAAVRFVIAETPSLDGLLFAPIQGKRFRTETTAAIQSIAASTMVVRTGEGATLVRSRAVLYLLSGAGGVWRVLATVGGLLPTRLLDLLYAGVARSRHALLRPPATACPIVPESLRPLFDLDPPSGVVGSGA